MSRYVMCPDCGRRMNRYKDMWGDWDGESYICYHCAGDSDEEEYDVGCAACGNPSYPKCKTSCPMFDE